MPLRQARRREGGLRDLLAATRVLSVPATRNLPSREFDIGLGGFHHMRGDLLRLGDDLVGGERRGAAAEHRGARGEGAAAVGRHVGVAHAARGCRSESMPSLSRQDDLVHRLVALAVRDRARDHRHRAAGIEAAPSPSRRMRLRGLLDDVGDADAAQLAARLAPRRGAARSRRNRRCAAPCRDSSRTRRSRGDRRGRS